MLTPSRHPCCVFGFSQRKCLSKSYSAFAHLSGHKILCHHYIEWWKFYTHIRSWNIGYFGMVEVVGLKVWRHVLQWRVLPIEFHKTLLIRSKIIRGGRRVRQTEWWSHELHFLFFKKRRLKREKFMFVIGFRVLPRGCVIHYCNVRN
jgi:hypothetical protein